MRSQTVAAALLHEFSTVVGIEVRRRCTRLHSCAPEGHVTNANATPCTQLLDGLYEASVELLARWNREVVPRLDNTKIGGASWP